jgi:hypothetical protein
MSRTPTNKKSKKGLHIYHWHHLGNGWLPSIRNYLAVIGGKIIIKDVWHPRLVRENDIILMDQFLKEHSLTEYQKAKLNSVRLWLRVLTLADITDPTGRYIEAWARTGSKRLQSNLAWPRQERPSQSAMQLWRSRLRRHFNPTSSQSLRIRAPLPL